jgi:hypothetical protein
MRHFCNTYVAEHKARGSMDSCLGHPTGFLGQAQYLPTVVEGQMEKASDQVADQTVGQTLQMMEVAREGGRTGQAAVLQAECSLPLRNSQFTAPYI